MNAPEEWLLSPHEAKGYEKHEVTSHLEKGPIIHHTEQLFFKTAKRYGLINITDPCTEALRRSKIEDGTCLISVMHITAGIYINDAESGLLYDIAGWIEKLAPYGKPYRHHQTGEDNGDAHLKSYLTNHAITVPITDGEFDFGTWQQIFYAEFDGMRSKRVLLKFVGI